MADAPKGINVRIAEYVRDGGAEVNHLALGYQQAGRFGGADPSWTEAQRNAFDAGAEGRREDNAMVKARAPMPASDEANG
ncbi:hypothetical protein [Sphingomonas sp.]|uniref:hypothetical protein n=1 Tax=Sphingomonas sp. TaxID=28214 RepID=UPI0035C7A22C